MEFFLNPQLYLLSLYFLYILFFLCIFFLIFSFFSLARNIIIFIPDFPDARPFRSHALPLTAYCSFLLSHSRNHPFPHNRHTSPHSKRHTPVALLTVARAFPRLLSFLFSFRLHTCVCDIWCTLKHALRARLISIFITSRYDTSHYNCCQN